MFCRISNNFFFGALMALLLVLSSASVVVADPEDKVWICHRNASDDPFNHIEVNLNAWERAHQHNGDFLTTADNVSCVEGGTAATPEPVTMLLFGAGLAGVGYAARRRKKRVRDGGSE